MEHYNSLVWRYALGMDCLHYAEEVLPRIYSLLSFYSQMNPEEIKSSKDFMSEFDMAERMIHDMMNNIKVATKAMADLMDEIIEMREDS